MIKIGDSEVSVKDFKKWLNALRSGKYKQTKRSLQNDKGFCCLGVACDVFIPKGKREVYLKTGFLIGILPIFQKASPYWLRKINDDFGIKTEHRWYVGQEAIIDTDAYRLVTLNDLLNFTFEEIADTLEAVYLWNVLE